MSAFNDFIAWHPSNTGIVSCKSTYQVEWNQKFRTNLLQHSTSVINSVWKSLSELSAPPKVHIFRWRSLHGIVPLKSILANRHVGSNAQGPICKRGDEYIRHVLFSCNMAVWLWFKLGIYDLITAVDQPHLSGSEVLEILIHGHSSNMSGASSVGTREVIAVTRWYLWQLRRKFTHEGITHHLGLSAVSILAITVNTTNCMKKIV